QADIVASPEDDVPRLIYADWLEENGDPEHADLIRVQIAHTRDPDAEGRVARLTRLRELMVRHRGTWLGSLLRPAPGVLLIRGFVEELTLPAEGFLREADQVYQRHPVWRLTLSNVRGHGEALAGCRHLGWVRELTFSVRAPKEESREVSLDQELAD